MKRLIFHTLFVFLLIRTNAQIAGDRIITSMTEFAGFVDSLDVNQDPRLNQLIETHIGKNSGVNGMPGFRVEVFSKTGATARDEAMKIKSEILSTFPEINVHIKFISPDFKVRAGDFRTKNEALRFMKQIEGRFKSFIVPDIIDFPKLGPTE